jgi:hypothetical protein
VLTNSHKNYSVFPSNRANFIIVESAKGTRVEVELKLLDYHYDCIPTKINFHGKQLWCSQLCCYSSCFVSKPQIEQTSKIMDKIMPLLQADSIKVIQNANNQISKSEYDKEYDLWKIHSAPRKWDWEKVAPQGHVKRADGTTLPYDIWDEGCQVLPKNFDPDKESPHHCIFLMENGLCATHAYFNDAGKNWVKEKFDICTTFPFHIVPGKNVLRLMDGFEHFTLGPVPCIDPKSPTGPVNMPQIIDSMKYAIVDRFGDEWYSALKAFSDDYRNHQLDESILTIVPNKVGLIA